LIVESTYGNRLHKPQDATLDELVEVLNATLKTKRGNVIVPAFALGRTQELLIILIEATRQGRLHGLNVYVDSPLAMAAMRVTLRHKDLLDADAYRALVEPGASGLPIAIHFIEDVLESKRLNEITDGAVIIAASGMCDGGRIKNHLEHNLARPECAVLFTGFQAAGTLGRKIVDGAPEVRIFGIRTPVRASVHTLGGLSAHADQAALLAWLAYFSAPPKCTFIVHGEADTAQQFAEIVHRRMNWQVNVPTRNETITLLDANSAS
jgi:metallo-beta-lactamase family protein